MHPRPACLPLSLQERGKARKRQRTGEQVEPVGVAAATKKTKKVRVQSPGEAASTQSEQNGGTAVAPTVSGSGEQAGEPQLAKSGFFSGKKFSELPLSNDILASLTSLNFTMTTKIQASCFRSVDVQSIMMMSFCC